MKKRIFAAVLAICVISGSAAFAATPSPSPTASPAPSDAPLASAEPTETADTSDDISESDELSESVEPTEIPSESAAPTSEPDYATASSLEFDISVIKHDYIIDSTMKLELYNSNGELLSTFEHWIGGVTESMHAHFDVPEYKIGEQFRLKTADGVNYMKYGSALAGVGNSLIFTTSGHLDDNGKYISETSFSIECEPRHEKGINMYVEGTLQNLSPRARIIDGATMVPVRQVAEKLGLSVRYNKEYNCVICSAGSDEIIFNVGTNWNTILGRETTASAKSCNIGGTVYVPVRVLADAASSSLAVKDYGERLDIAIGESELVKKFMLQSPVNARGLSSATSYLVWVSKHEFKVRVYTGSQYKWKLEKEFPCAIGAPGSETITGTFKYEYRMPSWDYGTYYVGPCLIFYGNYAMHSTLQYYGGGDYDGRVGVKISHGCVRLRPQDINWLDSYLPRRSTVYITE